MLLATHNAEEAFELCDRVGVLHRGRLLAVGQTSELAREAGEDRFALWIRPAQQAAIDALVARGMISDAQTSDAEQLGWARVECVLPGGLDGAAHVVAHLNGVGVQVGRCEPVKLSLADLLERVLARHGARA